MPFDPPAETVCNSLSPTVANVLKQPSFKLASQSKPAASLQRPEDKKAAEEYDAFLANAVCVLERKVGREVTIEQAKRVCMSNIFGR